jgi:hypothetical protein
LIIPLVSNSAERIVPAAIADVSSRVPADIRGRDK